MKKLKLIVILFVIMFPCIIFGDTFSEAKNKASEYITSGSYRNTYKSYINTNSELYPETNGTGGLLTLAEFTRTYQNSGDKSFSYLYTGSDFWLIDKKDNTGISMDGATESSSIPFTKTVEYVKSEVNAKGSGSYANPWYFIDSFITTINVVGDGYVAFAGDTSNKVKTLNVDTLNNGSTVRIYAYKDANSKHIYLKNSCNFTAAYDNDKKATYIDVTGASTNRNCTVYFGDASFKITIKNEDGSTNREVYYAAGLGFYSDILLSNKIDNIATPSKKGYTFKGYYLESSSGRQIVLNNGNFVTDNLTNVITYNTFAVPVFEPITYQISYNCNGGSGSVANTTHVYDNFTSKISSGTCSKDGSTFKGWCETNDSSCTAITSNSTITKNYYNTDSATGATLYAKWEKVPYTLHFSSLLAGSSLSFDKKTIYYGEPYGELAVASMSGYHTEWCTYWLLGLCDSGSVVSSSTVHNSKSDVTVYATWERNKYFIKYDGNGATSGSMSNSEHEYGTSSKLSKNQYTKNGYKFAGWSKTPNGSVYYSDQESISIAAAHNEVVTLYAVWGKCEITMSWANYLERGSGSNGSRSIQNWIAQTNTFDATYCSSVTFNIQYEAHMPCYDNDGCWGGQYWSWGIRAYNESGWQVKSVGQFGGKGSWDQSKTMDLSSVNGKIYLKVYAYLEGTNDIYHRLGFGAAQTNTAGMIAGYGNMMHWSGRSNSYWVYNYNQPYITYN